MTGNNQLFFIHYVQKMPITTCSFCDVSDLNKRNKGEAVCGERVRILLINIESSFYLVQSSTKVNIVCINFYFLTSGKCDCPQFNFIFITEKVRCC